MPNDWIDQKNNLSKFRVQTPIIIFRPSTLKPVKNLQFTLRNKIGGFFVIGGKECVTEITFDRNEYFMGETARVKIVCDNTKCDKEVKSFKFKLHRRYRAYRSPGSIIGAIHTAYYME